MKILDIKKNQQTTEFIVSLEEKEWIKFQENSFKKIANTINIPGFRKGHAPKSLINSKINKQDIFDRAFNPAVDCVYKDLIANKKFSDTDLIEDTPKVDIKTINEKEFELLFTFENFPKAKVVDCENLKLNLVKHKISDDEVNDELKKIVKKNTMLAEKESDTVENGDFVIFDFKGSVEGNFFPGGEAKNYQLEIGSNNFIAGFEEQMVGMKKNEEKDIKVLFPEDYHEKSLAGKPAIFKVKINTIKSTVGPKIDDDFAKKFDIKNVESVDDLKKFIKKQMMNKRNYEEKEKTVKIIADHIVENSTVDFIPDSLLNGEIERLKNGIKQDADKRKIPINTYVKNVLNIGSESELNQFTRTNAERSLKLVICLNHLIKKYKVEITEKEINDYLKELADAYDKDFEQFKKDIQNQIERIEIQLTQEKLFDVLIDLNKK